MLGKYFGAYLSVKDSCFDCIHLEEGIYSFMCYKKLEIDSNRKKSPYIAYPHKCQTCKFFERKDNND